jgi:hypothetical protein
MPDDSVILGYLFKCEIFLAIMSISTLLLTKQGIAWNVSDGFQANRNIPLSFLKLQRGLELVDGI